MGGLGGVAWRVVAVYAIHWFRRDLRVRGNTALLWGCEQFEGRVLGVFFLDSNFLKRADFSHQRFAFFLATLRALREELRQYGGDLLVLDAPPSVGFPQLLEALSKSSSGKPQTITFNRDYEPFSRKRDENIRQILESHSVLIHTERDHLLIEPHEILKSDGSFYQVYTPFARRWFERLQTPEVQKRIQKQIRSTPPTFRIQWKSALKDDSNFLDQLDRFATETSKHVKIPLHRAGFAAAMENLTAFRTKVAAYQKDRDLPGVQGTSRMSTYLKNGSITSAQVLGALKLASTKFQPPSGPTQFVKELVWREFYYHLLYHCPRVENEAFQKKYKNIEWENRQDLFEAWKEGKTGYPIVDAGMRELNQTGWMHNRVRMIVASFLTKDLLINWQWGERYFMEKLLDGDLAPNNGGWQWAASTGADPQPYFRIFNPTLQGRKFDPEGLYIKTFVPELSHLSAKEIHEPQNPIVDHAERRDEALEMYQAALD